MLNDIHFINPPSECRGMPFWSLNDTLDPLEMARQVEEFHRAGMGGFFLHSRIGLITEYLGDKWFEALDAAVKKAAELGMQAWLYDEDKWPSGYAGGRVPAANPEYRSKVLARLPDSDALPDSSSLITRSDGWNYFIYTTEMGEPWFNGACWVDLMNPNAVRAFIDSTHEKYRKRFGQYFGTVIPGIFTDEPIMRLRESWTTLQADYVPYSPSMHERYERNYGESPLNHLAELFEDSDDAEEYRYRYWRSAAEQFTEAYTRQIAEWCGKYNLMLTGHFMYEDSIEAQCRWIGAAMPHYRFMQMPGIDHLGLNINNPLTAKQCSSVVNQLGKPSGLSEMYGCSGQNMTFEDREWIAGRHAALGISFICHHLSLYSLRGCRKRDYPPTFSHHQPYWNDNKILEEQQARLTYLLNNSRPEIDLLVIHPVESGWRLMRGAGADSKIKQLDDDLKFLVDELLATHHDFEFGDESLLAEFASVEDREFRVGCMSYKTVIVPPVIKLRESTETLLRQFAANGGKVIRLAAGDGAHDLPESEFIELPPEVMAYRRKLEDGTVVICFFNTSRKTEFALPYNAESEEIDLTTGQLKSSGPGPCLVPAQTRCFTRLVSGQTADCPAPTKLSLASEWAFNPHDPNALPLDFAAWSLDGTDWNAPEPVIGIKEQLDKIKYAGKLSLRFCFDNSGCAKRAGVVVESSRFLNSVVMNGQMLEASGADYYLDPELPIYNANLLSGKNTIELEYEFIPGEPTSLDDPEKRYGTEIENIYVIGDFSVSGDISYSENLPGKMFDDHWNNDLPKARVIRIENLRITDLASICHGELVACGLPFYAGTVTLTQDIELQLPLPTVLEFKHLGAISCQVKINGVDAGTLYRRPWRLDISKLVKAGENRIELILKNSLRNLLGPHHSAMGEYSSAGPYSFTCREYRASQGERPPEQWSREDNRRELTSWTDAWNVLYFGIET